MTVSARCAIVPLAPAPPPSSTVTAAEPPDAVTEISISSKALVELMVSVPAFDVAVMPSSPSALTAAAMLSSVVFASVSAATTRELLPMLIV